MRDDRSSDPGRSNQLDLYQQVILEHNRHPRNCRKLLNPTQRVEGLNPLCGDRVAVSVCMAVEGSIIEEVAFEGQGCAFSQASASLMTEAIKGRSLQDALGLVLSMQQLLKVGRVSGGVDPAEQKVGTAVDDQAQFNQLGKLRIFAGVWRYPARVKCASLAWHALGQALRAISDPQPLQTDKPVSTESLSG